MMSRKLSKAVKLCQNGKIQKSYFLLEKYSSEANEDELGAVYFIMGCCCLLGSKYKTALNLFNKSLKYPLSPEGLQHFGLANAYYYLGDIEKATESIIIAKSCYDKQGLEDDVAIINHVSMRYLVDLLHANPQSSPAEPVKSEINTNNIDTKNSEPLFNDTEFLDPLFEDTTSTDTPAVSSEEKTANLNEQSPLRESVQEPTEKQTIQSKISDEYVETENSEVDSNVSAENNRVQKWIANTPFYILNVGMSTSRSEILEASETLMLETDNETIYQTAANDLTNVKRRIMAELHWFPGESEETVEYLLHNLKSSNEQIDISDYRPLTRINYCLSRINQRSSLIPLIIKIDQAFNQIKINEIQFDINSAREEAEIPSVDSPSIISDGIENLFSEAVSFISKIFEGYNLSDLARFMTTLSDQTIAKKKYNRFIEKLLNNYEVMVESTLSEYNASIQELCTELLDKIKDKHIREGDIPKEVNHIIHVTEDFDEYAQPLQLLAQAKGQKHAISSDVALSLRSLAVKLHNEYDYTTEAIKISNALTKIFAEAADIVDRIEKDLETLKGYNSNKNDEKNRWDDLEPFEEFRAVFHSLELMMKYHLSSEQLGILVTRIDDNLTALVRKISAMYRYNPALIEELYLKIAEFNNLIIFVLCKEYRDFNNALFLTVCGNIAFSDYPRVLKMVAIGRKMIEEGKNNNL